MNVAATLRSSEKGLRFIMKPRLCSALLLLALATYAYATSWDDDSHYVSLGPRNGYYIVSPDSPLFRQLGRAVVGGLAAATIATLSAGAFFQNRDVTGVIFRPDQGQNVPWDALSRPVPTPPFG